jgi:hypothetical protein
MQAIMPIFRHNRHPLATQTYAAHRHPLATQTYAAHKTETSAPIPNIAQLNSHALLRRTKLGAMMLILF